MSNHDNGFRGRMIVTREAPQGRSKMIVNETNNTISHLLVSFRIVVYA